MLCWLLLRVQNINISLDALEVIVHDTCIAPLSGSHFFSQFLLFASKLELFSISLEGSIKLSGVDCTYSSKSSKDNRTKR